MPGKKKYTGLTKIAPEVIRTDISNMPRFNWDHLNSSVKDFDRQHFTVGGIDLNEYHNPTNTVTILDEYFQQLAYFFCQITLLLQTFEGVVYNKSKTTRNSLAKIQQVLQQLVTGRNFKTLLESKTDIFKCRFIQKTVSEINSKNYLANYLEEITDKEPNELYEYNQNILSLIKNISDTFSIPQTLFEYISDKFEKLIVGHIPFFDDLSLIKECPQILGTEKIINKLEEINKIIIETGNFIILRNEPSKPEETIQDLSIIFDTAAAKYLTLRELGLIENILAKFNGNKTKSAEFIASITNEKAGTIKPFLSYASGGNPKHNPETEPALNNAIAILNQLGLNNEVTNLQNILLNKESKKGKNIK